MKRNTFTTAGICGLTAAVMAGPVTAQSYAGHKIVLGYAEAITHPDSGVPGRIEYYRSDLGNGQLDHDFVPNDPRASWNTVKPLDAISYGVKPNFSADPNLDNQGYWMHQSFAAWAELECSKLELYDNGVDPNTPGLIENFFTVGTLPISLVGADVTQIGFRGYEFPYFAVNPNVLGVAFTLFWTDAQGNLTDIDRNGKIDLALREIYYNDEYDWGDNGAGDIDFPTVAIHEAGHGLSAAHFGNIGTQDGELVANPRAIMNAIYGGPYREISARDTAIHCSNWAQWP